MNAAWASGSNLSLAALASQPDLVSYQGGSKPGLQMGQPGGELTHLIPIIGPERNRGTAERDRCEQCRRPETQPLDAGKITRQIATAKRGDQPLAVRPERRGQCEILRSGPRPPERG